MRMPLSMSLSTNISQEKLSASSGRQRFVYMAISIQLPNEHNASHQKSRAHRRCDLSVARPRCAIRDALCSGQTHRPRQRRRDCRQYINSRNDVSLVDHRRSVGHVIFICLGVAFYRLLSSVNKPWAMLMMAFVFVSAAVGFLNTLNNIAAFILFRGTEFLTVFDKPQRNALAMLFLRLHTQGDFISEIFWGLWLFPFGLLVFRSGFLPRFLGVWLIIACFAWMALSIMALFFPLYYDAAFR